MMDRIRELALAGLWSDVISTGVALLPSLEGEERARCFLYVSTAYAMTARNVSDLETAAAYVRSALDLAAPGGLMHTWALQKLSSFMVDTGRLVQAQVYAHAYLRVASLHHELAGFTGYVYRDLGIIASRRGDPRLAVNWYAKALNAFLSSGHGYEIARTKLQIAWAYCRMGRPGFAKAVMPETVPDTLKAYHYSTLAAIAAADGNWARVPVLVRESLRHDRPFHDNVDVADVYLLAGRASRRFAVTWLSGIYTLAARYYASLQNYSLRDLYSAQRGGDSPEDATVAVRGSADLHDAGCLTTGIA